MSTSHQTPATTVRSVRAACESLATARLAPDLWLVDNGKHGDDHDQYRVDPDAPACTCPDWQYRSNELGAGGCKHIRRVRMVRGEIDITPLLESDARVNGILLRNLGVYDD
jgi:hypothetical protein